MLEKYDIWNILHDGEIADITGQLPKLRLRIAIPYLRDMFFGRGDSFWITLNGCSTFSFVDFNQGRMLSSSQIIAREMEILSMVLQGSRLSLICTDGVLALEYREISYQLDTGKYITLKELEHASNRYWNEWEKRAKDRG